MIREKKIYFHWASPPSLPSMFEAWFNGLKGCLSPKGRILWLSIPHIVYWFIWMYHNACAFDYKESSLSKLKDRVLAFLFRWVSHLPMFSKLNFSKDL